MPHISCRAWIPSYTAHTRVVFMGTGLLGRSQSAPMLCYAKQCCFPNKLYFISKPAEQSLDRVSLSEGSGPWSPFLSPVTLSLVRGPLRNHLVPFDTTNKSNAAYPDPAPPPEVRDAEPPAASRRLFTSRHRVRRTEAEELLFYSSFQKWNLIIS